MSDVRKEAKVLTDNNKKIAIYNDILSQYLLFKGLTQKKEIMEELERYKVDIGDRIDYLNRVISPDEFTALACLGEQISMYSCYTRMGISYFNDLKPQRKKLIEYLCIGNSIKKENLLPFITATTVDIKGYREFESEEYENGEYELNIKHIFEIMDGKDPYEDFRAEKEAQNRRNTFKAVK